MPLMALVLGRLTANFTGFGSADNKQSTHDFMKQVQTNAYVLCQSLTRFSADHPQALLCVSLHCQVFSTCFCCIIGMAASNISF